MKWQDRIEQDPAILVGKPVVKGTRLSAGFVEGLLAQGWSESDVLKNYPGPAHEDVLACQDYSSQALRGQNGFPAPSMAIPTERKSMHTVASIMADLRKKGTEKTRKTYARHGMATDNMFGVSVADLKVIAKKIKGLQALACELYATGNMDAMYLAGMVADGSQMTKQELNAWAEGAANLQMIAEYTVPWVTVENPHARDLAIQWINSKKGIIATCGWCTYAGLVATQPDEALDLAEIEGLLSTVVKGISSAQNRVRYTMNGFVIAV